jgi:hypothetical protein
MLKNTFIVVFLIVLIACVFGGKESCGNHKTNIHSKTEIKNIVTDELINALIFVESRGNDKAVNKQSGARGCLQLKPIYVKEVNRLYGTDYTFGDAFNRQKSIEIVKKYLNYYGSRIETPSYENLARIHNGGPNGHKKSFTKQYWVLVKKSLNNK